MFAWLLSTVCCLGWCHLGCYPTTSGVVHAMSWTLGRTELSPDEICDLPRSGLEAEPHLIVCHHLIGQRNLIVSLSLVSDFYDLASHWSLMVLCTLVDMSAFTRSASLQNFIFIIQDLTMTFHIVTDSLHTSWTLLCRRKSSWWVISDTASHDIYVKIETWIPFSLWLPENVLLFRGGYVSTFCRHNYINLCRKFYWPIVHCKLTCC